jgi:hypothetical protein
MSIKKDNSILNSENDLDSLSELASQNFLLEQIKKKKGLLIGVVSVVFLSIVGIITVVKWFLMLFNII